MKLMKPSCCRILTWSLVALSGAVSIKLALGESAARMWEETVVLPTYKVALARPESQVLQRAHLPGRKGHFLSLPRFGSDDRGQARPAI